MKSIFISIIENQIVTSIIVPLISSLTPLIVYLIKAVVDKNRSKKRKIRFFISELLFKGFKTDSQGIIEEKEVNVKKKKIKKKIKQYQLDGYLVCEENQEISFLKIQLPDSQKKICTWDRGLIYQCHFNDDEKVLKKQKESRTIQTKLDKYEMEFDIDINKMRIGGRRDGILIIGDYTSTDNLNLPGEKSLYVNVNGEKEDALVQKCPNIRKKWLIFYILFSMVIIFLGVASLMVCFEGENWELIKGASSNLQWVLRIYGVLFLFITAFFVAVIWKCLSAYYVLIKMKKFGIPPKKPEIPVAETMLVPRIFQYMTGTEIVDNLL